MNECVACGEMLPTRGSQAHVCDPSRLKVVGCADPEGDRRRAACDVETLNAVTQAVELVESGWAIELAITIAMKRVEEAARSYGWYRGYEMGRAYRPKNIDDLVNEALSSSKSN